MHPFVIRIRQLKTGNDAILQRRGRADVEQVVHHPHALDQLGRSDGIPDSPTGHRVSLGGAADRDRAVDHLRKLADAEVGTIVGDVLVDLVGDDPRVVPAGEFRDLSQLHFGEDFARRLYCCKK